MPELPDITVYLEALETRIKGATLNRVRINGPFLLRTVDPPVSAVENHAVTALERVGKRIAIGLEHDLWLVIHLMIAGRLHWREARESERNAKAKAGGKQFLAAFEFSNGTLTLTEAGVKRRTSLHVVRGREGLASLDPGGIDVLKTTAESFRAELTRENHTLKRALTDPRVLSGIGNAYSDEILHAAMLSPLAQTQKLKSADWQSLFDATQSTLRLWIDRLRAQTAGKFPAKVTAFHEEMAVHGRYGKPCPRCGDPVLRIRYADNETNYCARCQTGGKVLADRGLSRLLGSDWPRTLDELEALKRR